VEYSLPADQEKLKLLVDCQQMPCALPQSALRKALHRGLAKRGRFCFGHGYLPGSHDSCRRRLKGRPRPEASESNRKRWANDPEKLAQTVQQMNDAPRPAGGFSAQSKRKMVPARERKARGLTAMSRHGTIDHAVNRGRWFQIPLGPSPMHQLRWPDLHHQPGRDPNT
jgi:hypothetical protein